MADYGDDVARMLVPSVNQLLRKAVDEAGEKVIKQAVADFEAELRKRIALTAMEVSTYFSLERHQNGIVITVKNPPGRSP